jgi:hypothetical protein
MVASLMGAVAYACQTSVVPHVEFDLAAIVQDNPAPVTDRTCCVPAAAGPSASMNARTSSLPPVVDRWAAFSVVEAYLCRAVTLVSTDGAVTVQPLLTAVTVMLTVPGAEVREPSLVVKVNESVPVYPMFGV